MSKRKGRIRWVTPRRLAGLGCLVALAVAAAFIFVLYQQVRNLFRPIEPSRPGEVSATQDVTVERGSIADGVHVYGTVAPARRAKLGFKVARGRVEAVPIQAGQPVQAGQTLVALDRAALERDLATARADLLEAEKELEELATAGSAAQELQLEIALRDARARLDQARRDLEAFDAGKDTPQAERDRAAAELAAAKAALVAVRDDSGRPKQIDYLQWIYNQAEVKHGEMVVIANPSEKDRDVEWLLRNDMLDKREALETARLSYEMDVRAAEHRVGLAERALRNLDRELAAGAMAAERSRRAAAVRLAAAAVTQAQERLAALGQDLPDVAVAEAQAKVLKLQGKVADAEAAVAEAEIVAPFDGIVDEVTAQPDGVISSGTAVVSLSDVSSLHLTARVSDVDVGKLKDGRQVRITIEAFRGQPPLEGRLGEIPRYGTYMGGLTIFEVPVSFDPGETPLRVGMTANIYVPLEMKEDVLLVPAGAVHSDGRDHFVWLVQGKGTERRKVRLGINDGIMAEVLEGLREGDTVRMPLQGPSGPGGGMYY